MNESAQEPRGYAPGTYSLKLRQLLDYEITQYPLREPPPERSSSIRTPSKNWEVDCDCVDNVEGPSDAVDGVAV